MSGLTMHYCKCCGFSFMIRVPRTYTGDALIVCTDCGRNHSRQIEAGVAVSCDPPRGKPILIREASHDQ